MSIYRTHLVLDSNLSIKNGCLRIMGGVPKPFRKSNTWNWKSGSFWCFFGGRNLFLRLRSKRSTCLVFPCHHPANAKSTHKACIFEDESWAQKSVFISISLIHCGDWKFNFYTPWTNSWPLKIGLKGPFLQRLGPGVKQLHPQYNGGRFVFLLLEMVKRKESPKPKGFPNGELITW